jgi:hypothetical protein
MQRNWQTSRHWLPIVAAVAVALLIVGLYGNGAGPRPGGIDPTFGLAALAGVISGTVNMVIGVLPLALAVIAGYFLVRWWLAPEGESVSLREMGGLTALFGSDHRAVEMTCPACAAPVRDRWQACPSCGYRMHVMSTPPTCPNCHQGVEQGWHVCPHCAATLPEVTEEQRVPARALVEAARREGVTGTGIATLTSREDTIL